MKRACKLYAPLIAQATALLRPGGYLVLELGYAAAEYVSGLFDAQQWTNISVTNDLAGIPRVFSAQPSDPANHRHRNVPSRVGLPTIPLLPQLPLLPPRPILLR